MAAEGGRHDFLLADGCQIQRSGCSAPNVKFDGRHPRSKWLRGKGCVRVAKAVQRPFVVRTDQGMISALGTLAVKCSSASNGS
ncbi:FecR domain-containing protein [Pseudomonas syringae group genomosp. 7]|uniref:FecR domain-containing protein n=1 Tax=Pseudomonas syringae group genomosp. 7 TaxID=251699 RepID=UPI000EFE5712